MRIAITAHGESPLATVDSRFSRADYFILYDDNNNTWSSIDNVQSLASTQRAGIQAGQTLAQTGAKVLITGHVTPKAFKVLQAERIDIFSIGEMKYTVEEALTAFHSNKLTAINAPNALDIKK